MADPYFVDMWRDIIHIVVEGHGHWGDETAGMHMLTSSSLPARLQGQQAQKPLYLFCLALSSQTIL